MKNLLTLYTKNVNFSFNNVIFTWIDGVAMGSPLGPVLAVVFRAELEKNILPKLEYRMLPWQRYVDDTITAIRPIRPNTTNTTNAVSRCPTLLIRDGNRIKTQYTANRPTMKYRCNGHHSSKKHLHAKRSPTKGLQSVFQQKIQTDRSQTPEKYHT